MPQEQPDTWKKRLAQCFANADGHWLNITTSYAKSRTESDLIVFCRDYLARESKLIARVPSHTAVFFLQGVLAEMNALKRGDGMPAIERRPAGRTWRLPVAQGGRR